MGAKITLDLSFSFYGVEGRALPFFVFHIRNKVTINTILKNFGVSENFFFFYNIFFSKDTLN